MCHRAINQIDQQQKSTAEQVKHEKFVPSPELDDESSQQQTPTVAYKQNFFRQSSDNFFPTNQYFKPMVHGSYHGTSSKIPGITANSSPSSQWKYSAAKDLPIVHRNRHINEQQNQPLHLQSLEHDVYANEREKPNKLLWNPTGGNGQWVWMPNYEQTIDKIPFSPPTTSTTTTTTTTSPEHVKWNYNEIYNETPVKFYNHYHQHQQHAISPISQHTTVKSKDHPYSFDSIAPTEASSSTLPSVFIYETTSDEEERYKHENRFHNQFDTFSHQGGPSTASVPVDWSQYLSVNNGRDQDFISPRPK